MKACITILIICIYSQVLSAQTSNNWYSFYNRKTDLIGFKDSLGNTKIPAQYSSFTNASTFRNIIAVSESDFKQSYYLLKNGRKVGKDSLYIWDMTYDCEQEGSIRFRDSITDRIGYFDKEGKEIIKALFNEAQPFYNGVATVIHDGKRVCADGKPYDSSCEHWYWDGITALINKEGKIIADNIDGATIANLNWYSMKVANQPADTNLYTSIKGVDNQFYTFIDYEKEFKQWFYSKFLAEVDAGRLQMNCFDEVMVEGLSKRKLRKSYDKTAFTKIYSGVMQKKISMIKAGKIKSLFMNSQLNNYIYNGKRFAKFYTDCKEPNMKRYPLLELLTNTYNSNGGILSQEHLSFLRTDQGYKLIEVNWKSL
jgi:hypothetical protein